MDIKDMLPLLLKNADPKTAGMMSALNGGDMSQLLESMMGADGKNKEMMAMLKMMQGQQKTRSNPSGLNAIYSIAPTDILGIMLKHYGGNTEKQN